MYIICIKDFIKQINIEKAYKKQFLDFNIEKLSLIIRINLNLFFFVQILIHTNQNTVLQINLVNIVKKIMKNLEQHSKKNEN